MTGTTHALLGIASYMTIKKHDLSNREKSVMLGVALAGSMIPDIDVVARLTEVGRFYDQMWHRGITHSLFAIPLWAALIFFVAYVLLKVKKRRVFWLALCTVTIHVFTDSLNPWGTGVFEPFSDYRLSVGVVSYADLLIPSLIVVGLAVSALVRKKLQATTVFRWIAALIGMHILIQSLLGAWIYQRQIQHHDRVLLAANNEPWHFRVIAQKDRVFTILSGTPWALNEEARLESLPITDALLAQNEKAKILHIWAPALVLQDHGDRYVLFDPRFYRDGYSFLAETIEKR